MEAINLKTIFTPDNNAVHGTLHYGAEWPSNVNVGDVPATLRRPPGRQLPCLCHRVGRGRDSLVRG